MRSALDFSPLFRSTIGFDRLPGLLETASRLDEASLGYPPYNIEKLNEESYRITMAVAGFTEDDLTIEVREHRLIVTGHPASAQEDGEEDGEKVYLHRGIARRAFQRIFEIADYVKAVGAKLVNGLLHVDLVRELPEEKKPRKIAIETAATPKQVADHSRNAA